MYHNAILVNSMIGAYICAVYCVFNLENAEWDVGDKVCNFHFPAIDNFAAVVLY